MRYFIFCLGLAIFWLGTVNTQAQTSQSFKQVLYYRDNEIWQFNPAINEHTLLFTTPQPIYSAQLSQDEQYLYLIEGGLYPNVLIRRATRIFIPTGIREVFYENQGTAYIDPNLANNFVIILNYIDEYNTSQCLFNFETEVCNSIETPSYLYWHGNTALGFTDRYHIEVLDLETFNISQISLPLDWSIDKIRKAPESEKILLFMIYEGGDITIYDQIFTLDLQTRLNRFALMATIIQ